MAMRMRGEGRIGTAIRHLRSAVELDPNFVLAQGELGLCHLWLKELEPAQVILDTAIRLDSEPLAPYLNLAIVLSEQGKPAEAEDVLRRAITAHPRRSEPHVLMAELRLEVGELDGAKQAALRAVALDDSRISEVYLLLADIYLRDGDLPRAAQHLENYIERAPQGERVGAARASLGDIRTRLETEAARPFEPYIEWVRLYRDGGFVEAARGLSGASTDFMKEASDYCFGVESDAQLQAAALLHTEAAVLFGTERTFHLRKGMEYLSHIEDESLRRDIQRRWFLAMGYFFQSKRRFLDAVPFFVDAAKLFPDDLEIRFAFGSAREAAGFARGFRHHLNIAEACYRRILEDEPENVEANLRLGHVLKLKRQGEEAVDRLKWTLSHADLPEHRLVANLVLGEIYRELGDLDTAIEFLHAAVEEEPGCQAAVTALSHALHRRGDLGDARYALKRFLEVQKVDGDDTDGWWKYLLGRSQRYETMMQQMREEVSR
jgi:tetratricopeptide (TPR) repeat protein